MVSPAQNTKGAVQKIGIALFESSIAGFLFAGGIILLAAAEISVYR
jgi:hypothetical protein